MAAIEEAFEKLQEARREAESALKLKRRIVYSEYEDLFEDFIKLYPQDEGKAFDIWFHDAPDSWTEELV